MNQLEYGFFNRDTVDVAADLIGKQLVFGNTTAIITETEAYRGFDDPASHAYRGPTKRSEIMFGDAGFVYVYLIYGKYYCLNIVTESVGMAGAVLIRGVRISGTTYSNTNGPGKLCRYLGINKSHNGINVINNQDFYLTDTVETPKYIISPRIGINVGKDKLWRFFLTDQRLWCRKFE